jgi:hypothetical protein
MKKGIYETYYGNAAVVTGPNAKTAWDLDMGERVQISEVNPNKYIRPVKPQDMIRPRW